MALDMSAGVGNYTLFVLNPQTGTLRSSLRAEPGHQRGGARQCAVVGRKEREGLTEGEREGARGNSPNIGHGVAFRKWIRRVTNHSRVLGDPGRSSDAWYDRWNVVYSCFF